MEGVKEAVERTGWPVDEISDRVQEDDWVSACQQGDALSFNRLVLKWERTVYNIALRMLHEREEAAEATQEIFLLAFQNIPRFRGRSRFSTWLYRIAVNCCISRIRRRPPEAPLSLEDDKLDAGRLQAAGTQVEELIRVERNRRISEALAQLTPEQRVVVELRFYQGMTFDEIGRVLAVSPSTVKSRLYAGLEILKIRLAGEE